MTDFFREVNEEVRRDRTIEFIKRYQTLIVLFVVLVLAATGGWRWWQTRQQASAEASGGRYEAAAQLARDGKAPDAETAFKDIAAQGPVGYALLARFRLAATVSDRDAAEAVKQYDALAADSSIDPLFRDSARLRAAMLRVDDADENELKSRVEPLAAPTAPFHASARELLALAALKRDDYATAGKWLDMIVTDYQAPAAIRQRAEAMLGLVAGGGRVAAPAAPTPPAPPAPAAATPATTAPAAAPPAPAPAPAAPAEPAPAAPDAGK